MEYNEILGNESGKEKIKARIREDYLRVEHASMREQLAMASILCEDDIRTQRAYETLELDEHF